MNKASVLSGWRLPADDMPRIPRWWTNGILARDGRAALLWDARSGRYELFRPPGTLVASGAHEFGRSLRIVGDRAAGFITADVGAAVLLDLGTNHVLWQHPCRLCRDMAVSDDGSRLAQVGADGTVVWDTRYGQALFQESTRVKPSATVNSLSPDGRRYAWTFVDTVFLRDLDSGQELAFPLDGTINDLQFDLDGTRLLVITDRSLTLREIASGRPLWSAPKALPDAVRQVVWSPDGRSIVLSHGLNATEVLDTGTGQRLAWFQTLRRVVTPVRAEVYAADLRSKGVAAERTWDVVPLPQPDETRADQSLARILEKTGLQFRGVDLVASP
jgi:WD40 repeat protein